MSRMQEMKQGKMCHDAIPERITKITNFLNEREKNGDTIYVVSDWHLFKRVEKGKTLCKKRYNFNEIINNYKNTVKDKDAVIFLGDLCDGELESPNELADIISSLPGTKILCMGNNDLFGFDKYREMGFRYVTYSFVWRKILFSHYPLVNHENMNIHGHLHNCKQYWIPFQNHIDVAYCGARTTPIPLNKIIAQQPEYSKLITVKEENFFKEQTTDMIDKASDNYSYNVLFEDPIDD